jgi:hypothetical protein
MICSSFDNKIFLKEKKLATEDKRLPRLIYCTGAPMNLLFKLREFTQQELRN